MIHLTGPHTPASIGHCNGCDVQHERRVDAWVYELTLGGITIRLCASCMAGVDTMFRGRLRTLRRLGIEVPE